MAEDLARAGRSAEAIDICWGLRADPALTLWNSALLNLLVATEFDVEGHPDVAKFANEAIEVSHELTRRMFSFSCVRVSNIAIEIHRDASTYRSRG